MLRFARAFLPQFFTALGAANLLVAQEPTPPRLPVDIEAEQRGALVRELTLEDVLRIGRAQNVTLRAGSLLPERARLDIVLAEAAFEPELYAATNYAETEAPSRNAFQPSITQKTIDATLGWRQRVVTGGMFDLAFKPARFDTSGSTAYPDLQFTSEWILSYRQPLLRGGWTDYNLARTNAARYGVSEARHAFDQTVQDVLLQIVEAYWELVFARENWLVGQSALQVAEEQLRITDARIEVRELAPRDRIADQAELARRREELIVAENRIRSREDSLRRLVFDGTENTVWRVNLRPAVEIKVDLETYPDDLVDAAGGRRTPTLEERIDRALAQRPELRRQRSGIAVAEMALLESDRDVLPGLDLVGGWSSDGVRDSFPDSFGDATDLDYPDWSVGLEFTLPIGNHAARARQQQARLDVERLRRELHAATLLVTTEVRDAVRNLESLRQSIRASAESVQLAESNLETERAKLRVGASTNFEVQRRNQELREARSRHLRNQLDHRISESRLLHVQGMLLVPQ